MAARSTGNTPRKPTRPPPTTPEAQERHMINLATGLAEKQLKSGEASAQVISHYLKLASSREKLEQERLQGEIGLLKIRAEAIAAEKRAEELFADAIEAFTGYSPTKTLEGGPPNGAADVH